MCVFLLLYTCHMHHPYHHTRFDWKRSKINEILQSPVTSFLLDHHIFLSNLSHTPSVYVPPLVSETNFNIAVNSTQNLIALNFGIYIFLQQSETHMILYQTQQALTKFNLLLSSCPTFFSQDTNVSVYTCKPTSLQATNKAYVFFLYYACSCPIKYHHHQRKQAGTSHLILAPPRSLGLP